MIVKRENVGLTRTTPGYLIPPYFSQNGSSNTEECLIVAENGVATSPDPLEVVYAVT